MMKRSIAQCSVQGCERSVHGKSYCSMHYQRLIKTGSVAKKQKGGCFYCDARMITDGLCQYHLASDVKQVTFWDFVKKESNGCWVWQGANGGGGYGSYTYNHQVWQAHRLAFFLYYGIKPQQLILHSCDHKRCVNPFHLREGSHWENSQDARNRNRVAFGERNGNARLTKEKVLQMRELYRGGYPVQLLADANGVHLRTAYRAIQGETWRRA